MLLIASVTCGMMNNELYPNPERLFKEKEPFFHVCSKPVDDILFGNDQDRKAALVFLALAAEETSATILAYAIMSNHIHAVISVNDPARFYNLFRERVNAYLARHDHSGTVLPKEPTIVPITSLNQLLDEIAYVIRNQYVVDKSVNPLSHIWCSGFLYFNPVLELLAGKVKYTPASELSGRSISRLTFSRDISQPLGGMKVLDDFPAPSSFVDYQLVEKLFYNARQFITRVFRNVEGQIETARLLGEMPAVPDEEMSRLMWKYCKEEWGVESIRFLDRARQIALAKHMKYTYCSSNRQIARITTLTRGEVDGLFPLSSN